MSLSRQSYKLPQKNEDCCGNYLFTSVLRMPAEACSCKVGKGEKGWARLRLFIVNKDSKNQNHFCYACVSLAV